VPPLQPSSQNTRKNPPPSRPRLNRNPQPLRPLLVWAPRVRNTTPGSIATATTANCNARWCWWLAPPVLRSAAAKYAYLILSLCCGSAGGRSCASIIRGRAALLRSWNSCVAAGILHRFLLLTRQRSAVFFIKLFLILYAAHSLLVSVLAFSLAPPAIPPAIKVWYRSLEFRFVKALGFCVVWFWYFVASKRVNNTYSSTREDLISR